MKKKLAALCLLVAPAFAIGQGLPVPIKQGMKYTTARKRLIDAGWQSTIGYALPNGTPVCYIQAERGMDADVEKGECDFEEIFSCSGTGMGFCAMQFTDGRGNYLHITTEGGPPPDWAMIHAWRINRNFSPPQDVTLW